MVFILTHGQWGWCREDIEKTKSDSVIRKNPQCDLFSLLFKTLVWMSITPYILLVTWHSQVTMAQFWVVRAWHSRAHDIFVLTQQRLSLNVCLDFTPRRKYLFYFVMLNVIISLFLFVTPEANIWIGLQTTLVSLSTFWANLSFLLFAKKWRNWFV